MLYVETCKWYMRSHVTKIQVVFHACSWGFQRQKKRRGKISASQCILYIWIFKSWWTISYSYRINQYTCTLACCLVQRWVNLVIQSIHGLHELRSTDSYLGNYFGFHADPNLFCTSGFWPSVAICSEYMTRKPKNNESIKWKLQLNMHSIQGAVTLHPGFEHWHW